MLLLVLCDVHELFMMHVLPVCRSLYFIIPCSCCAIGKLDESCMIKTNDMTCLRTFVSWVGYAIKSMKV